MINARRFGLASVTAVVLVLLVAASPATARSFKLTGRTDTTNPCNAGALFRFTVTFAKGRFKSVKDFQTYGVNFDHQLFDGSQGFPPPSGSLSGLCIPGYDDWETHYWQAPGSIGDPLGEQSTEIPTGSDPLGEVNFAQNEFRAVYADTLETSYGTKLTVETKQVVGTLYVKRNKKTRKFKVRAVGDFVDNNGGESGLEFGGFGSGHIAFNASNKR